MLRSILGAMTLVAAAGSAAGCGGAADTDFTEPSTGGTSGGAGGTGNGTGGTASGNGGSGASATGGAAGTGQAGSAQGGASSGGTGTSAAGGSAGLAGGAAMGGTASGGMPNGGTGGSTTGGTGGNAMGGSGGGGGDCPETVQAAQQALEEAQGCNLAAGARQCTGQVEDLCGCTVPVNNADSDATEEFLELREEAIQCGIVCPAIPCRLPGMAICQASSSGSIRGRCEWAARL